MIPPIVIAELKRNAPKWKLPDWVTIQQLDSAASTRAAKWIRSQMIDPGEAEAVSLVLQVKGDWLLTDDAQARQFAESLGVETHGSVGILLWAVAVEMLKIEERLINFWTGWPIHPCGFPRESSRKH
jgi:predicted nucleic acid-binding protein